MTDLPRYYQPLEIPAYCFIWEAVMWVTFGRFPEGNGYQDEDELKEELGLLSFAFRDSFGGPRYRFKGFWWFETEMAGVEAEAVDWDRYERALRSGYQRADVLEYQLKLDLLTGPDEPPLLDHLVERNKLYRSMCEKELEESPFVESVHRLYQQQVDRGWSRIFDALVDGKLKGFGWGELTQDEIRQRAAKGELTDYRDDNEGNVLNPWHARIPAADTMGPLAPMAECKEIPRREWSLGGIAPDGRYVTAAGRHWWDVCFPSDQLFALFPRPLLTTEIVDRDMVEIVNPGLAIGAVGDAGPSRQMTPSSAGRGRKKLADGEVERACQALYGRRYAAGEQETPLHAEASDFTMKVWGTPLARSTFQSYMLPFKRVPEITPEIAAE